MQWELAFGIGAVIVLAALAYGLFRSSGRKKVNDPITEAATKELYRHPGSYEDHEEDRFRSKLK